MKTISFLLLLSFITYNSYCQDDKSIYKNPLIPVEDRITDLLSRMTLEEKILQLNQYTAGLNTNSNNIGEVAKDIPAGIGSLIYFGQSPEIRNEIQRKAINETRLGIPILFGFDVIHGFRTVYPISLAQACSWNPALVTKACAMAAKEAKLSGIDWTFSPMIDVAHDSRWGRVSEGYGEDSYVNSVFGVASVKGYQGEKLSNEFSIAACLKHYVGYSESEAGRDYTYTDVSPQSLWEIYLPPYEACVKAGAATLMSAFNDISGIPASANHYTLTEILKEKWQHDGFVVSDWGSVQQLIHQGVAADNKEAALKAFKAGVEMDMVDNLYFEQLPKLINEKKISIAEINEAVKRILRVKFRLGLFENPYSKIVNEKQRYLTPEDIKIAQQLATESIVLLKNQNNTLPISSNVKQIAIIGPLVKDNSNMLGSWSFNGKNEEVETIFTGLQHEFQGKTLNYAKGCDFEGKDETGFKDAVEQAKKSDIIFLFLGEKKEWSGENASRSSIALPEIQEKLVFELKKTGKPITLILSNGRPLELIRIEPIANAIVEIWQPGVAGGSAIAGILSGRINPSGKLAITFPLTTGQIPIYYSQRQSARPFANQGNYQDIPSTPLYWFGHGLSYTTFKTNPIKLSTNKLKKSEKLIAEIEIENTGEYDGVETVLWYISDPFCSISRPKKELKYFEKKEIKKGEKYLFKFEIIPERDLSFVNSEGNKFLESGEFFLIVNEQIVKFEITD